MAKEYPAKLLLFGEYTIIKGSQALALPLPLYRGHWARATPSEDATALQQSLPALLDYLRQQQFQQPLRLDEFAEDLLGGDYFASTIPRGYGAGSSGALCAAIYDRYGPALPPKDLIALRNDLALMESFFHGSSSGIDPLICYLDQSIRLLGKAKMEVVALPSAKGPLPQFFLLDTQMPRETEPLVKQFLQKCEASVFLDGGLSELIIRNNRAIEQVLAGQWENLFSTWREISQIQQEHFTEMIPPAFQQIWQKGITEQAYLLKLCGAGGGGFLLGITNDWETCRTSLADYTLLPLSLFAH